jgi:hypothetical protein
MAEHRRRAEILARPSWAYQDDAEAPIAAIT